MKRHLALFGAVIAVCVSLLAVARLLASTLAVWTDTSRMSSATAARCVRVPMLPTTGIQPPPHDFVSAETSICA